MAAVGAQTAYEATASILLGLGVDKPSPCVFYTKRRNNNGFDVVGCLHGRILSGCEGLETARGLASVFAEALSTELLALPPASHRRVAFEAGAAGWAFARVYNCSGFGSSLLVTLFRASGAMVGVLALVSATGTLRCCLQPFDLTGKEPQVTSSLHRFALSCLVVVLHDTLSIRYIDNEAIGGGLFSSSILVW